MALAERQPPDSRDVYTVPMDFIACLKDLSDRLEGCNAKWAIIGDTAEVIQGVHVRPNGIEIVTDREGGVEIFHRLSEYAPPTLTMVETRLMREAEVDGQKLPVFVRSQFTSFKVRGVDVSVHGGYETKVGNWDWGDPLVFEPTIVNMAGVPIPVMPIPLSSEIYLMLGWMDRVSKISDALARAHHALHAREGVE